MGFSLRNLFMTSAPKHPRRHPRMDAPNLRCPLGEAVDISMGGMRVRASTKPVVKRGEIIPLWIEAGRKRLHLAGRVVWTTRRGKVWHVGVMFLDLDKRHEAALEQLSRFGCFVPNESKQASSATAGASASTGPSSAAGNAGGVRAGVDVEDLYGILGVARAATQEEITAAFRKLARQLHPDVQSTSSESAQAKCAERFALVHKAYSVLRDPSLRQRYDGIMSQTETAA